MISLDAITVEAILLLALTGIIWSWLSNPIKNYNSPHWLPLLGNAIQLAKNKHKFHNWVLEVSERFKGQTWAFQIPFQQVRVVSNDPQTIRFVLKENFDIFLKGRRFHDNLEPLLGDGIFNVDGEPWRVQRKKTSRIFTGKNFREFISKVSFEEADNLHSYLKEMAASKGVIDIHDIFHRMTMDTFCRIAFGYKAESLTAPATPPFSLAFNRIQNMLRQRMLNPYAKYLELVNGGRAILRSDVDVADELIYKIISQRKNDPRQEGHHDLLSIYLGVADKVDDIDGITGRDSEKFLRDMVMNIILAGRDTTGQGLSYTLYCLLEHPEVLAKLREEIQSKPRPTVDSDLYDIVAEFPYTHAVFKEALRLYPPVPGNTKECQKDCVLPDGTAVKKGWVVTWSTYTMSRKKSVWGEDADKFIPERWLTEDEHGKKAVIQESQYKYPIFHGGPRICLGMNLAILEAMTTLIHIMNDFDFKLLPGQTIEMETSITAPMRYGMKVEVSERS
ncbi:cytochrome P450 [Basidiobolus meristosporus CBS 931.73]|uniref:Cytochrome P450 n=1 Tax=Basidiobolus meristosporus CBS 931.73 TaxID=1314790 RepID=A0A1Y1YF58_9FUNG|nr:cytochrome P450 [Basidiobolus meristosporus CBS 931.73]|eukprot:ORX96617.1 cytochrome P450 [Basidiobolus meristosporus CBS 931.73]